MVKEDDMGDEEKMETKGKIEVVAYIESVAKWKEKRAADALKYGPGAAWYRYNLLDAEELRELVSALAALPDDDERFRRIEAAFVALEENDPEKDRDRRVPFREALVESALFERLTRRPEAHPEADPRPFDVDRVLEVLIEGLDNSLDDLLRDLGDAGRG